MTPQDLKTIIGSGLLSFPLTDFDAQGDFDPRGYAKRLEWLAPYGATALFAAGGTGEFFSLTADEYPAIIKTAVDTCRGKVPIIAGAGGPTRFAIQCAQAAEKAGAHGVLLLTPVYWYQVASPLKLMMDRLVCADGGNPDPTSTQGKKPQLAKQIELQGWDYPKRLAGRAYGVVVHGDVAGIEGVRRSLCDWLDWMGLVDAGSQARLDRFIGYYQPYASSHGALDKDRDVQEEVRNAARALAHAVGELRAGRLQPPDAGLRRPRPK